MKLKKLLCVLVTLCMLISILSVFALAAPDATTGGETDDTKISANADGGEEKQDPSEIVVDDSAMTGDGTTGNPADLASFALASENANLAFYVNDITGFFALVNKKTGAIWYSNPLDWEKDIIAQASNREQLQSQLVVTYLNASYDILTIPSTEAHIVSEHKGNQQIFTYVFSGATRNFSIPVSFELKDNYLDVQVKVDDIEENSDARITQITLLPFLGAGGFRDNGYALIPDGSGSLMTFNKICKNLSQYTGYIYNRDLTASSNNASYVDLNETISLPVYGISKNGAAYLSVITQGAGTSAIKCNVSRLFNSYNSVSSHMVIRDTQTRRNATGTAGAGVYYSDSRSGNLTMRVYPLDADKSDYIGMAETYRKFLIEDVGLAPLDNSSKIANSVNLELFCAVKTSMHFLGIPYTGVKKLTSLSDVQDIINQLKAKNIENAIITLSGWVPGGLASANTVALKPESKIGGLKEAKKLIAYAKEQGVTLMFDDDVQNFYTGSKYASKFDNTAFSLSGTPVTVYPFSKSLNRSVISNQFYHLIHPDYMIELADDFVDNAKKLGVEDFSFKSAGTDPYAAYNDDMMLTRDKSAEKMQDMFKSVADKSEGIISTRVGNSYVLGSADNIVEVPVYSSDLILSQTSVPFYQIVLRGYVNMAAAPMNLSSEVSELELKCAESGLSLFYQLMDSDSTEFQNTTFSDYYACSFDDYFPLLTSTYERMKSIYDAVGVSTITGHEIYSNTARITTFSNGAKVYVNYAYDDADINGVKVAARAYTVVGGDK